MVFDGFSPFEHGWIPLRIPSSASRTIDSPLKPIQIPLNVLPYSRISVMMPRVPSCLTLQSKHLNMLLREHFKMYFKISNKILNLEGPVEDLEHWHLVP